MAYTTTELLDSIKVRAAMPTNQNTYTTARMLAIADDELRAYFIPLIMKAREYYYAYDVTTSLNATGVYDIHTRAIGGKLINAYLLSGTQKLDLAWLNEEEMTQTDQPADGRPGIYFKRSQVFLKPADPGYDSLVQTILLRPGNLCATSAAAQITGISGTTLTFASSTIPSTWTTSNTFDLVQQNPHFDTLGIDLTASSITSTTIVLSATPSSRLAVGDWISLANTTPVVQIPVELQNLHSTKCAATILRAQGSKDSADRADAEIKEMEKNVWPIYSQRIEDEGKKIVQRNGILRRL